MDEAFGRGVGGFEIKKIQGETMKKVILIPSIVMTILLLMVQISPAGVVVEQQVKDREGKVTRVILNSSKNRLRTDHPESGQTTILDFKGDQIVLVDHRSKNYFSMKLSQWEKEMAKQLRLNNPSIRPKERVITVRRLSETATVNGFNTEKIQVLADGELIEEHWMTKDIEMDEIDQVMERASQGASKEFRSELREGREIQQKLKPYGFSILIKDYALTSGLGAIDVLEVKRIERKALKDEVFLPPSGYERVVPQPSKK